jgi:hypothetical protein
LYEEKKEQIDFLKEEAPIKINEIKEDLKEVYSEIKSKVIKPNVK